MAWILLIRAVLEPSGYWADRVPFDIGKTANFAVSTVICFSRKSPEKSLLQASSTFSVIASSPVFTTHLRLESWLAPGVQQYSGVGTQVLETIVDSSWVTAHSRPYDRASKGSLMRSMASVGQS